MNYTKAFENVKYFGMLLVNYRKTAINTYPVARKRKQPEPNRFRLLVLLMHSGSLTAGSYVCCKQG